MNAVADQTFQGAYCRNCGRPIRMSIAMVNRQAASNSTGTDQNPHFITKVFPARCRSCLKESLYILDEIEDISEQESPRAYAATHPPHGAPSR